MATKKEACFGNNFAVLNLDLMAVLLDIVKNFPEGQLFASKCATWIDVVHNKSPQPPTIFTSLFFSPGEPELAKGAPFTKLIEGFGSFTAGSPGVQVASDFQMGDQDIFLQKTRWSASSGNRLVQILRARNIDTVIISGLSLSGVVMSTVYELFDLDFNIFVISDNVLELPVDQTPEFAKIMLHTLMPKMNVKVISLEEALQALSKS